MTRSASRASERRDVTSRRIRPEYRAASVSIACASLRRSPSTRARSCGCSTVTAQPRYDQRVRVRHRRRPPGPLRGTHRRTVRTQRQARRASSPFAGAPRASVPIPSSVGSVPVACWRRRGLLHGHRTPNPWNPCRGVAIPSSVRMGSEECSRCRMGCRERRGRSASRSRRAWVRGRETRGEGPPTSDRVQVRARCLRVSCG